MNALACRLWELHQVTARLRVRTILEATALLKRKYRQNPHGELAVAIALHYWLLAMRADNGEPYAAPKGKFLWQPVVAIRHAAGSGSPAKIFAKPQWADSP